MRIIRDSDMNILRGVIFKYDNVVYCFFDATIKYVAEAITVVIKHSTAIIRISNCTLPFGDDHIGTNRYALSVPRYSWVIKL